MEQTKYIMPPTEVPDTGLPMIPLRSGLDKDNQEWGESDRGVSFTFGTDVVSGIPSRYNLGLPCRAHQVVENSYEFFAELQPVTLFSVPKYCGKFDNAKGRTSVDETHVQLLDPDAPRKN